MFNVEAELVGHAQLLPLSLLDKHCVYLDAKHLYVHIKWETFQIRTAISLKSDLNYNSRDEQ